MTRLLSVSIFLFVALGLPNTAFACSIAPPPPMTDEEKAAEAEKYRQDFLEKGRSAEAIVRVKVLSSAGYGEGRALVKVLKTLRGKAQRGMILQLRTIDSAMCGWGELNRGERGIIMLDKERPRYFNGFLGEQDLAEYRKEGILPPED